MTLTTLDSTLTLYLSWLSPVIQLLIHDTWIILALHFIHKYFGAVESWGRQSHSHSDWCTYTFKVSVLTWVLLSIWQSCHVFLKKLEVVMSKFLSSPLYNLEPTFLLSNPSLTLPLTSEDRCVFWYLRLIFRTPLEAVLFLLEFSSINFYFTFLYHQPFPVPLSLASYP